MVDDDESGRTPQPGEVWRHYNGNLYKVVCITNEPDDARYPKTVVYRGPGARMWSRPLSDWHRSMQYIATAKNLDEEVTISFPRYMKYQHAERKVEELRAAVRDLVALLDEKASS